MQVYIPSETFPICIKEKIIYNFFLQQMVSFACVHVITKQLLIYNSIQMDVTLSVCSNEFLFVASHL